MFTPFPSLTSPSIRFQFSLNPCPTTPRSRDICASMVIAAGVTIAEKQNYPAVVYDSF